MTTNPSPAVPDPECEQGMLRLIGGVTPNEGRVEVCFGGRWGSICDDKWDDRDAAVTCRELGYTGEGN